MKRFETEELSFDEFDELVNPRPEENDFDRIVEAALDRRGFLGGVLAFGSFATLGVAATGGVAKAESSRFAFDQIPANSDDAITVPAGYKVDVVVRWGDPILPDGAAFDQETRGTAESQALAFGDNNDGMDVFSPRRQYTNRDIIALSAVEKRIMDEGDIAKGMMAHGVSVMEVAEVDGKWSVVKDSPYNRRITPADRDGPDRPGRWPRPDENRGRCRPAPSRSAPGTTAATA